MFGCCGCPSKKTNRAKSDDEDEEEKKASILLEETGVVRHTANPEITVSHETPPEKPPVYPEPSLVSPVSPDQITEEIDVLPLESTSPVVDEFVATLPDVSLRKSSLKKPKPRLSISNDVLIIPTAAADSEEPEDGAQSPLSDEVFAGEASDPPRANLGVPGLVPPSLEFPRSPNPDLDVPASPRGKAPTPHPKRASMPAVLPRWLSEDDDEAGGLSEPPVTPVAKDELALRRHRFFADLLAAAQAATEHRVRFDPLGPEISKGLTPERVTNHEIYIPCCSEESDSATKEFEALLERLEKITARLEKAVPFFEEVLEPLQKSIFVTKSLEDLLDEHLTPTEKEKINGLISDKLISPDSSADLADISDRDTGFVFELLHDEAEGAVVSDDNDLIPDDCLPLPDLPDEAPQTNINESFGVLDANYSDQVLDLSEAVAEASPTRRLVGERECEQSDTDDNSSESPDTVVCDTTPPPISPNQLKMTNSQSTLNMSVQGFESIVQGPFASFTQLSAQIGGDVAEHAKLVQNAFQAQLKYVINASQSRKPSPEEEKQLLQPTSQCIAAIQDFREKHRSSPLFNHLSAISESIPALGWVAVVPTPAPFIKEMNDAGQFYTNRVLKDWKEKDKKHVEWAKAWVSTLTELQAFVKLHHTTGLVWAGTGSASAGAGIPPPPPGPMPPPPPPLDLSIGDIDLGANDRSALFAEINRGDGVTKGLKKVTSDMQTHKNPAIRSGPAPFKAPVASRPVAAPAAAAPPAAKPPKFARDGKKWLIEYQTGNKNLVVDGAEMNNVVYAFRCTDSVITVKGKINSIFIDSCKKTAVVFDSVVSSVEFVNSQSVQMQVLGTCPTISIDKTDGCQMYLSNDSLKVEIVSSKSSEMNVLVPKGNGDFAEYPIPEQFRTTIGKSGLTTTAVESTG